MSLDGNRPPYLAYPVSSPAYAIPVISQPKPAAADWQILQHHIQPKNEAEVYQKPVIALIDDSVQSAAEDVVMYLHHAQRAVLLGRSTAGCQGNVAFIELPGGGWMQFTGMEVRNTLGQPIQRQPIQPDVLIEAEDSNTDALLAAAMRQLDGMCGEKG